MSNYQVIYWDTPTQQCAKCSTVIVFDQAAQAVETWHGIEVAVCLVLGHVYPSHVDMCQQYGRSLWVFPGRPVPVPTRTQNQLVHCNGSWRVMAVALTSFFFFYQVSHTLQ